MAKKPAKAKASDGEAIPDFYRDIEVHGVTVKGLRKFEPGPDGLPTQEELDAVEAQRVEIAAIVDAKRKEAESAERANREAKEEKARQKKQAAEDRWTKIEARLDALEKARA